MSKPAARLGDMTAHGGAIVAGAPTVLIGGQPAARVGDMHTCPMVNPGVPPPPHVGGPITLGSFTVLICGQPAARMGDMCTCAGPPDSIAAGCPTVLIGDSGGGGGGGGGAGGSGGSAAGEAASGGAETEVAEVHNLDVKFVDKGGFPIAGVGYSLKSPSGKTGKGTLMGRVKQMVFEEGDYEIELKAITKAEWSKKQARDGEKVKMLVETAGIKSGKKAVFEIWERSINTADQQVETISDKAVSSDKVEAEWQYVYHDEDEEESEESGRRKFYSPAYYFIVKIENCQSRSALLEYKDFVELYLKDADEQPIANASYLVFLSNGEVREGQLDSNGYKKIENVPPGKWSVEFPDYSLPEEV